MVKYDKLVFWRYEIPHKRISFICIKCKDKFKSGNFFKSRKDTYLCLNCGPPPCVPIYIKL